MPLKLYTIGSLTDRTSVLGPALRSMLPNAILFSKDPRTASSSTALTTQSIWPDRATACNVPLLYVSHGTQFFQRRMPDEHMPAHSRR